MAKLTLQVDDRIKVKRDQPHDRFEGKIGTIRSVHQQSGCYSVEIDVIESKAADKLFVFFEHELIKYQICPGCSSDNINSRKVNTTFTYGETVVLPVEFTHHTCTDCGAEYTDDEAEDAKTEAIAKHKAKTK